MSSRKRQWSKPQLIVLGRGTPEENVLKGCKLSLSSGAELTGCVKSNGGPCAAPAFS